MTVADFLRAVLPCAVRSRAILSRAGRALRRAEGVTALEFALVAPVLLLLILGSFEISRLVWLQVKLDRVTNSMGDLITRQKALDTDTMTGLFGAIEQIALPFPTGANSRVIITSISLNSNGVPIINWQRKDGGTLNQISRIAPCPTTTLTLPPGVVPTAGAVLIVTEMFYSYAPVTVAGVAKPIVLYRDSFFSTRVAPLDVIQGSPTVCG